MKQYYDARAAGYDGWYSGLGRFDGLDRAHRDDGLRELERTIAGLAPARTLDVACGSGFLTRHLRGEVTGLDQSERMLALAREQAPKVAFVHGDAFDLPFPDESFDRVFAAHFYGHLEQPERALFLAEAPGRAAARRRRRRRSPRQAGRRATRADPRGRLALGGLQALLHGRGARERARRHDHVRGQLVRRRIRMSTIPVRSPLRLERLLDVDTVGQS